MLLANADLTLHCIQFYEAFVRRNPRGGQIKWPAIKGRISHSSNHFVFWKTNLLHTWKIREIARNVPKLKIAPVDWFDPRKWYLPIWLGLPSKDWFWTDSAQGEESGTMPMRNPWRDELKTMSIQRISTFTFSKKRSKSSRSTVGIQKKVASSLVCKSTRSTPRTADPWSLTPSYTSRTTSTQHWHSGGLAERESVAVAPWT